MNNFDSSLYAYSNFPKHKQYAEVSQEDPNLFRTFFLQKDHIARRDRIIGLTNWITGIVPSHIQVIHPLKLAKIRSGASY